MHKFVQFKQSQKYYVIIFIEEINRSIFMENESLLFDLLEPELQKYRHKIDDNRDDNFTGWVAESRAELENKLSAEQLKLVDSHLHDVLLKYDDTELMIQIRLLNLGVKIGMQLQKAFDEE